MPLGRIDMQFRRVACQPPSDLSVIIDQNRGAGGWIRLQVKVLHARLTQCISSQRLPVTHHSYAAAAYDSVCAELDTPPLFI